MGILTNYTAGNPSQNTGTSGSWNTNAIVSVSLGAGSYMVYAFVLRWCRTRFWSKNASRSGDKNVVCTRKIC